MKYDDVKIYEAYVNSQIVEEGLYDVAKSRLSQGVAAVKGTGQRIAGGYKQLKGDIKQKTATAVSKTIGTDPKQSKVYKSGQQLKTAGASQIRSGKEASKAAKYNTYINSSLEGLIKDLKRLRIPITNETVLKQQLFKVLLAQMPEIKTSAGQFSVGSKTKVALK